MLFSLLLKKLAEISPPENGLQKDLFGVQYGSIVKDMNLHKIVICLDPTKEVIVEAAKLNSHLIISHHGLTHRPVLNFNDEIVNRINLLAMNQISLFVMHTAWDAAPEGISEVLTKYAGLKIVDNFYFDDRGRKKPIGRIGVPLQENTTVKSIGESLKRHLKLDGYQIGGNPDAIVKRAAVAGGHGLGVGMGADVLKAGCDTYISGEFKYPEYLMAAELGFNLIATSHYKSEKIGMENLQKILSLEFPRDEFVFIETEDPVKLF
jgi:dinuclear metal center YbgI/SA1388 family protein